MSPIDTNSQANDTVDPDAFRQAMGGFLTGVAVMTTEVDGVPHGMTANALTSVSLTPPMVLVCVGTSTWMAEQVTAAGVFALSFLAADQRHLSDRFADPGRGQGEVEFAQVPTITAVTGVRLLAGAVAHVDCRVAGITPAGDHLVVLGDVVHTASHQAPPLAYFRGGYGRYAPDAAPDSAAR